MNKEPLLVNQAEEEEEEEETKSREQEEQRRQRDDDRNRGGPIILPSLPSRWDLLRQLVISGANQALCMITICYSLYTFHLSNNETIVIPNPHGPPTEIVVQDTGMLFWYTFSVFLYYLVFCSVPFLLSERLFRILLFRMMLRRKVFIVWRDGTKWHTRPKVVIILLVFAALLSFCGIFFRYRQKDTYTQVFIPLASQTGTTALLLFGLLSLSDQDSTVKSFVREGEEEGEGNSNSNNNNNNTNLMNQQSLVACGRFLSECLVVPEEKAADRMAELAISISQFIRKAQLAQRRRRKENKKNGNDDGEMMMLQKEYQQYLDYYSSSSPSQQQKSTDDDDAFPPSVPTNTNCWNRFVVPFRMTIQQLADWIGERNASIIPFQPGFETFDEWIERGGRGEKGKEFFRQQQEAKKKKKMNINESVSSSSTTSVIVENSDNNNINKKQKVPFFCRFNSFNFAFRRRLYGTVLYSISFPKDLEKKEFQLIRTVKWGQLFAMVLVGLSWIVVQSFPFILPFVKQIQQQATGGGGGGASGAS